MLSAAGGGLPRGGGVAHTPTLALLDEAEGLLQRVVLASRDVWTFPAEFGRPEGVTVDEAQQEFVVEPPVPLVRRTRDYQAELDAAVIALGEAIEELQRRVDTPHRESDINTLAATRDALKESVEAKRKTLAEVRERLFALQLMLVSVTSKPVVPPPSLAN